MMHRSTMRQARDAGSNGLAVRLSDIALASAAIIFVAPLMVVVAIASRVDRRLSAVSGRDPRTSRLVRLLHKSSLDELPRLIDVVRGRFSLVAMTPASKPIYANGADEPPANWQAPSSIPAATRPDPRPRHEVIHVANALQDIGRHLRDVFFARATAEYDDLLRAIDRAHSALVGEPVTPGAGSMKAA